MDPQVIDGLLLEASHRVISHRRKGLSFNVFDILNVSEREVRCHSAFISALLNPNGLHGQGNEFLRQFIERLKALEPVLARDIPMVLNNWHVYIERPCRGSDGYN